MSMHGVGARRGPPGLGDIMAPEGHWKQTSADRVPRASEVVDRPVNYGPPACMPPNMAWVCQLIEQTKQQFFGHFEEMFQRVVVFSKRASYLEPPFFSRGILEIEQRNITAGATAPGEVVISFAVPPRHRAVINCFGMDADDPSNFEVLTWTAAINGVPIPPYDAIGHQLGSLQTPFACTAIRLDGGKVIEFRVANSDSVVRDIRMMMAGYFYPLEKNIEFAAGEYQL